MKEDDDGNIEIDITDEESDKLVNMWIEKNLTKESISVYAKDRNLEAAILNEAVIDVLKDMIENQKKK